MWLIKCPMMTTIVSGTEWGGVRVLCSLEIEKDGLLPFLDVLLHHQPDGSLHTFVYRKPTHTDRYLDFSSHHPLTHKRSVVTTLFSRANSLSSTMLQCTEEESHLTGKLKMNGYPRRLIHSQKRSAPTRRSILQRSQGRNQKRLSRCHTFKDCLNH